MRVYHYQEKQKISTKANKNTTWLSFVAHDTMVSGLTGGV